jgi:hypothetical protein
MRRSWTPADSGFCLSSVAIICAAVTRTLGRVRKAIARGVRDTWLPDDGGAHLARPPTLHINNSHRLSRYRLTANRGSPPKFHDDPDILRVPSTGETWNRCA